MCENMDELEDDLNEKLTIKDNSNINQLLLNEI